MAVLDDITAYAQSIRLAIKNRYQDAITDIDGQTFLSMIVDWTNQFIDELEDETDTNGNPINWNWVRQLDYTLGTVPSSTVKTIAAPTVMNNLVAEQSRYVLITVGGNIVSFWNVVQPADMSNKPNTSSVDTVTYVGSNLVFSRNFNSQEVGGTITGDITTPLPRMVLDFVTPANNQADILTTVKPKQLLILGCAKNMTLPDIVQGPLSPSYVQKFNDLLTGAIARNGVSTLADTMEREDFSFIRGVGM